MQYLYINCSIFSRDYTLNKSCFVCVCVHVYPLQIQVDYFL